MQDQSLVLAHQHEELCGVDGWLKLLVIKLCLSTVLRLLAGVSTLDQPVGFLNIGFAVLSGIAAYLLCRRNRKGVEVAKAFLAADAAYYAIELGTGLADNPQKTAGFGIAAAIWLIYLYRSVRVKNTYLLLSNRT